MNKKQLFELWAFLVLLTWTVSILLAGFPSSGSDNVLAALTGAPIGWYFFVRYLAWMGDPWTKSWLRLAGLGAIGHVLFIVLWIGFPRSREDLVLFTVAAFVVALLAMSFTLGAREP